MITSSASESKRRRDVAASVVGTHSMEGIQVPAGVRALMERHARGELTTEQFSDAVDQLAAQALAKHRQLAGAA